MTVQVWQSNLTGEKIYTVCEIESPYYTYIGTEEWPDPPEPGGGGGGESTIAWRPTVSADGTISWTRTSTTNTPTPVNVRGEKGDKGDTGEQGTKGDTGEQGVKGDDGFSPAVTITEITGGHRVNITDKDHPQGQSFDVMDGKEGINFEVGAEKWYGTYTDENGVTYQVYSKMIYIPALPSTAGTTTYPHGVSGIKQILQVYGFTADGFVLNAPRQNVQDNIAIYQASKSASNQTLSIEVGKDRSNKAAYVCLVYAKNN